jgi:hypothetical protein
LSNGERSINVALKNANGQFLVKKLVSIRMPLGNDETVAPPHLGIGSARIVVVRGEG